MSRLDQENPHTLSVRTGYVGRQHRTEPRPHSGRSAYGVAQPRQFADKPKRQQSGERRSRQWSGGFETTALLVIGEQPYPEAALSRRCRHVRADGSTIGAVVARFHPSAPPPATGTLLRVGALVEASNGAARGAPLFRLTVLRWDEVTAA